MREYQCKCGAVKLYGSGMLPNPCEPCAKCGVVPGGTDPIPHEFVVERVETDDGVGTLSRCRYCLKTMRQIERAKEGKR